MRDYPARSEAATTLDRDAILAWLENANIGPNGEAIIRGLLRQRGELRQRLDQADKAVRSTAEDWQRKGMPLGRYFANYAAEMWCAEAGELRQALGLHHDAYRAAMERVNAVRVRQINVNRAAEAVCRALEIWNAEVEADNGGGDEWPAVEDALHAWRATQVDGQADG